MSSASMLRVVAPVEGSGPQGCILYFDPDPQTAMPTIAGLHAAGYEVRAAPNLDEVRKVLAAVEIGSQSLVAVVIDACSAAIESESVFVLVEGCTVELPIVVLTHRERPKPFSASDDVPCLRRPFATPLLVRLLHHLLGDPLHSSTPVAAPSDSGVAMPVVARIGTAEVHRARQHRGAATPWIVVGVATLAIVGTVVAFGLSRPRGDDRTATAPVPAIESSEPVPPAPTVATRSDPPPAPARPFAPPPADAAPPAVVEEASAAVEAVPPAAPASRAAPRRKSASSKRSKHGSDARPSEPPQSAASSVPRSAVEANPYR